MAWWGDVSNWEVVVTRYAPVPVNPLGDYEWGKEYVVNGIKPNIADDIVVEFVCEGGISGECNLSKLGWKNDGVHKRVNTIRIIDLRYAPAQLPSTPSTHPVTAVEFLNACVAVQSERGQEYDPNGAGERSFAAAAVAFTALTGKPLVGSDICLVIELVKKVRQYSKPDRIHHDSLLDSVSYDSLWAAELIKELK
jgi:hypothetical protein